MTDGLPTNHRVGSSSFWKNLRVSPVAEKLDSPWPAKIISTSLSLVDTRKRNRTSLISRRRLLEQLRGPEEAEINLTVSIEICAGYLLLLNTLLN